MLLAVPNVSEGRTPQTVSYLAGAADREGVRLLHLSSDIDHNRSVLWLAGEAAALVDASVDLARRCLERIDVRRHDGAHPRVGALDVLPFVPHDAGITEAVEVALRAADGIARLGVPVYLYGAASAQDRPLPAVRTSFERLGAGLVPAPTRPDLGPATLHPSAGAACVGARRHLVAFNVVLRGGLDRAREIAASVREASGGLAGVRALGLALPSRGLVQVSMNLVAPERTGPRAAFERVADHARELGVEVIEAEVIGLVPESLLEELSGLPLREVPASVEQRLRGG